MGIVDSIINAGTQIWANKQNEALMREGWEREDTAVSRRVEDLKAAGLSPVLAAGSAASSSAPIQMRPPQVGGLDEEARLVADMVQQKKNLERTQAEIDAINAKAVPDKKMAEVINHAWEMKGDELEGGNVKTQLALNWIRNQNAAAAEARAAASERATQAAMLSRMLEFDKEKGVFNPAMRDMAGNTEYFRQLMNNGDAGDWIGAMLQLAGKYRGGK